MRTVAVAVALGLGLWAAPGASAAPGRSEQAAPATVSDVIVGFTFVLGAASLNAPGQVLRIHTGDTVEWTNLDPVSHSIAFDAMPGSLYFKNLGDKGSMTFDKPGYYTYRCPEHPEAPGMEGLVFVTDRMD
ncbi:MAG: plastocyanin/azurin family copper-binding protein [Actinomycetota bacterium]